MAFTTCITNPSHAGRSAERSTKPPVTQCNIQNWKNTVMATVKAAHDMSSARRIILGQTLVFCVFRPTSAMRRIQRVDAEQHSENIMSIYENLKKGTFGMMRTAAVNVYCTVCKVHPQNVKNLKNQPNPRAPGSLVACSVMCHEKTNIAKAAPRMCHIKSTAPSTLVLHHEHLCRLRIAFTTTHSKI